MRWATRELLHESTASAAQAIARQLLDDGADAAKRLGRHRPDALHDFRVALRRLRVHLNTYEEALPRAASKKLYRRVKRLFERTNQGRDADVARRWLNKRARENTGVKRAAAYLGNHLDTEEVDEDALKRRFAALQVTLEKRLAKTPPKNGGNSPFASHLNSLLGNERARLLSLLELIESLDDTTLIHQARIQAKRFRYLMEASSSDAYVSPIGAAKDLQRMLGDIHDLQFLDNRIASALIDLIKINPARSTREKRILAGLLTLRRREIRERTALFRRFIGLRKHAARRTRLAGK